MNKDNDFLNILRNIQNNPNSSQRSLAKNIGFPDQLEKLLGGFLGMISGWLGSFFSAGSISQENDDDIKVKLINIKNNIFLSIFKYF